MSTFHLRPAKKEDVPSLVKIWYTCFHDPIPLIQQLFPDSQAVRRWYGDGFGKLIAEGGWCRFVVVVEVEGEGEGKGEVKEEKEGEGRVVGVGKYIIEPASGIKPWQESWGSIPVVAEMDEDLITEKFFGPMERQHGVVMRGREHLFLEIIAIDPAYQKRGLAGKILDWGRGFADELGVDCYLDGGRKASGLYEKFGWQKMEEMQDEKCTSIPMVRKVGT